MTSCCRATPSARVLRPSKRCSARRATPAAAGASEGCPSGYIACLWRAMESSIRKSANSRERAAFSAGTVMDQNKAPPRAEPHTGGSMRRKSLQPRRLGLLVHPTHSTARHRRSLFLLLLLHHDALGREEQARDGCGILQSGPGDLGRVDDAGRDQVLELIGLGVVAEVLVLRLLHLANDDSAFRARVLGDDADRLLEGPAHDLDAGLLIVIVTLGLVQRLLTPQQRYAAARHDAFLDRRAGRMQHLLAAVTEARRLDGADFQRAAELVDDERRQRLTLDVLGDDQHGPA